MLDLDRVEALNRDEPSTASRTLIPALVAELRDARAEIAGMRIARREALDAAAAEVAKLRAEIERLRTAAADERADVVAWLEHVDEGGPHDEGDCVSCAFAYSIRDGAHVGAAKGGERG